MFNEVEEIYISEMTEETLIASKPQVAIVVINETEYWCEEIRAKHGRVAGVYLVDEGVGHYLYSFTPGHWLQFVANVPLKNWEEWDEEKERSGEDHYIQAQGVYLHRDTESLAWDDEEWVEFARGFDTLREAKDSCMEGFIEYVNGNDIYSMGAVAAMKKLGAKGARP